jgi:hypothetical protein
VRSLCSRTYYARVGSFGLAERQGIEIAQAVGKGLRAMVAPLPRGEAGGIAHGYFDGTFMPESEKDAAALEEYERYAAGGRARARTAMRNESGRFLGSSQGNNDLS